MKAGYVLDHILKSGELLNTVVFMVKGYNK